MDMTLIKLLVLDVDGVLTDGRVVPGEGGDGPKQFHTQDGCAIKLWLRCGGEVAILSGRSSDGVRRRAAELGIQHVHVGCANKPEAYEAILAAIGCAEDAVGYVGDDLPDLGPMARCAFPVAVANAAPAVKRAAMYVTRRPGGFGAVAEVIELLLRKRQHWSRAQLAWA